MGTPWYKRYSQVQETDLGRVPEWGAPGTKSAACARLTLVQVNLKPALLPACRFQRGSQPSQIVRIRDGFQDLGKKATSTPCLPTWPALSIFRILGFFSIVPQAAGATGSQATCGDIAGLPKPFHGRLGFPGSQCRDVEPTATVLTAGSTKRSPPTPLPHNSLQPSECSSPDADIFMQQDGRHQVRMQLAGSQPHISQKPCAVSKVLWWTFWWNRELQVGDNFEKDSQGLFLKIDSSCHP